jgi:hypothetical protein
MNKQTSCLPNRGNSKTVARVPELDNNPPTPRKGVRLSRGSLLRRDLAFLMTN